MKDVGQRVEKQRKSLGLTVRDVEDRSRVSSATIYRIERGDPKVKEEKRARVIRALAEVEAQQAALRLWPEDAGGAAQMIERHANALLEIAKAMRGQNGDVPPAGRAQVPLPKER